MNQGGGQGGPDRDPVEYRSMVERLAALCGPAGFDVVWPARVGWYNRAIAPEYALPDLGDPGSLVVIIGNTRVLWPIFRDAVAADAALAASRDPLDQYTERVIGAAVAACAGGLPWEVRFSHEPPPRRVAMQHLAQHAGLAYLAPSHLSVHPVYGPWFALRAAVVVAVSGPERQPRPEPPCDCQGHCMPHLARALAGARGREATIADSGMRARWRDWVAVRDACPVGRDRRYSEEQIRYHYIKDRGVLLVK